MKRSHGSEDRTDGIAVLGDGRREVWPWPATAGVCGIGGGLLAGLTGLLMVAGAWLTGHLEGGLLISTIPLLMLGAHCLDLSDRREASPKRSNEEEPCKTTDRDGTAHLPVAGLAVCLLVVFGFPASLCAQQTIFNVPSTDVLDKGKVYAELDASLKPTDGSVVTKFSSFVPCVVVGAGGRVEIGLNITGNIQPGADTTTLVPAIKWKPYQGKSNGVAIVVGDHLYLPVRNRAYNAGNYIYAEVSKTFKTGTRVTAGGYDFTRSVVATGNRAGGQFGFEQPLNKKVTLAADYFTGQHAAGYFTPGVVLKVGPKVTGYAGYSIGNLNPSGGNHFFLLELGYNFN